ncbi:MAG: hypothetical protein ACMUJM_08990 [bacterium]
MGIVIKPISFETILRSYNARTKYGLMINDSILVASMQLFENAGWLAGLLLIDENVFVLSNTLPSELLEDLRGAFKKRFFRQRIMLRKKFLLVNLKAPFLRVNRPIYILITLFENKG